MKVLHIFLRPVFASGLFLAQFSSARTTWFTDNPYLVMGGAVSVAVAIGLLTRASLHLRRAANKNQIAQSGPYRTIRHPVYVSIYLLSFGLGVMFFAWLWFVVLVAFIPLWYLECRREEQEMPGIYGTAYARYREKTKMFIPGVI